MTLQPAYGVQDDYVFSTDSSGLMRLLEAGTDLPSGVIQSFMGSVVACESALLRGVDISRHTLRAIGFRAALD